MLKHNFITIRILYFIITLGKHPNQKSDCNVFILGLTTTHKITLDLPALVYLD